MPPPEALPPEIAALASRQALHLREAEWEDHMEVLLTQLESRTSASHRAAAADWGETAGETNIRSQFQAVASRFYGAPIDERIAAAEEIANLGGLLPFEKRSRSRARSEPGERVGAAIALAAHLQTSQRVRDDPEFQSALRKLLNAPHSRVRYRAAEVLRGTPALAYKADLGWIDRRDRHRDVRVMAGKALARAG